MLKRQVSQFLCESRYGCFSIQINDQGREFVNSVSAELHRLNTGTIQRVTSANHPQANSLVERQKRTVKNSTLPVDHMLLNVCFLLIALPHRFPQSILHLSFYTIEKQSCRLTLSTIQRIFQTFTNHFLYITQSKQKNYTFAWYQENCNIKNLGIIACTKWHIS